MAIFHFVLLYCKTLPDKNIHVLLSIETLPNNPKESTSNTNLKTYSDLLANCLFLSQQPALLRKSH